MTTMVENVAKVIVDTANTPFPLSEYDALNLARAAIEAMMEPTPEMLVAGEDEDTFMANGVLVERSDAAHHYAAMIQAALKEEVQ